ncbi:glycoside hydrolase family 76 protein [Raineyella sp.]|uniref:glycoside hydrolase family 76 protein n=1 Tax=Raineyella sp. TaxID=1911550 RepID=UPI002B1FE9FB|nr:glycoside hydrolase family 76 protein [Raineyella sp.]MEA5153661.1 glycoside hydrolase family 76 protein [Raineyella sp.]
MPAARPPAGPPLGPDRPAGPSVDPALAARAAAAERSVTGRHLHRPLLAPRARLAWTAHPPTVAARSFVSFHYWWQAHVLDCLLDAQRRAPTAARRCLIAPWPAAMALRNGVGWLNEYYDDNAWLGLALDRMEREQGIVVPARGRARDLQVVRNRGVRNRGVRGAQGVPGRPGARGGDHGAAGRRVLAVDRIVARLEGGWDDRPLGGGIPWRVGDVFRNVPANGPMAILMARRGRLERACRTLTWLREHCLDAATGLVVDGIRPDPTGAAPWLVDRTFYTYNQGVMLGAEVAVLRAALDRGPGTADIPGAVDAPGAVDTADTTARVLRLVEAIDRGMADGHVLVGYRGRPEQGGDEGLFRGILARYLALVATDLPGGTADAASARGLAARLVRTTAEAAWQHRARHGEEMWFGPDPRTPARIPRRSDPTDLPERDLSVQVGAWMLLEAAARCPGPRSP